MNEHLNDVLCHCDQTAGLPQDGHPLSTPGCISEIKPGRYHDKRCSRDHYGLTSCPKCHSPARGTRPACGKYVRVVVVKFQTPDGKALYGAVKPGMAPHRTGGRDCPGVGRVPTETTYTVGRAVYEYFATRAQDVAS